MQAIVWELLTEVAWSIEHQQTGCILAELKQHLEIRVIMSMQAQTLLYTCCSPLSDQMCYSLCTSANNDADFERIVQHHQSSYSFSPMRNHCNPFFICTPHILAPRLSSINLHQDSLPSTSGPGITSALPIIWTLDPDLNPTWSFWKSRERRHSSRCDWKSKWSGREAGGAKLKMWGGGK